jgi:hypothetical protein
MDKDKIKRRITSSGNEPGSISSHHNIATRARTHLEMNKINEKRKENLSHPELSESLHLNWGLDHYPNYLYRQKVWEYLPPLIDGSR